MNNWKKLQRALEFASRNSGTNVKLSDLAAETDQSPFHAHRELRAVLGETPKHFTLRLRLDRAAAALLSSRNSILVIALTYGFRSHEAFCRVFCRQLSDEPKRFIESVVWQQPMPARMETSYRKSGPAWDCTIST